MSINRRSTCHNRRWDLVLGVVLPDEVTYDFSTVRRETRDGGRAEIQWSTFCTGNRERGVPYNVNIRCRAQLLCRSRYPVDSENVNV